METSSNTFLGLTETDGRKNLRKMRKVQTKSALQRRLEDDVLMASKVGDAAWLQQCFETKNVSLDFTDGDGLSAIHLAALECKLDCVKILVKKMGVDINCSSSDGWTPLHLAINNTIPELSLSCLQYLIENGADPSSCSNFGVTPMHQAAACGNVQCLQVLIDAKGVIDAEDDRGHTPYSLSVLWSYRECARILQHHQWQKDKKSEDKTKKELLKNEEIVVQQQIEREQKEKAERRLKGQKAYQLWLGKNQFAAMPGLFGQDSIDGMNEGSNILTGGFVKRKSNIGKGKKKGTASRAGHSRATTKGTVNKKIDLLPVRAPGSPTPGRRVPNDPDKRASQHISLGRMKAVQKRGPLQFPVI